MVLLHTDMDTLVGYSPDSEELEMLIRRRRHDFPVLRDGTIIALLSGDALGRVQSVLFDDYRAGERYFERAVNDMAGEEDGDA